MSSVIYKSKSQVREENAQAVEAFLAAGGKIEICKPRRAPKQKMRAKGTRSSGGSSSSLGFRTSSAFRGEA